MSAVCTWRGSKMSKFTQGEIDTMIEAMVTFMRLSIEANERTYGTLFLSELVEERRANVMKILANKPEYSCFYLTEDEMKEFGGQQ